MSCPICVNPYNKSIRAKIPCPMGTCQFEACKECVRTYLLSSNKDPHCMNCREIWNEKFLIENINRNFHDKELKNHRKSYLTDVEISKLPETMNHLENIKIIRENEKQIKLLNIEVRDMLAIIHDKRRETLRILNENRQLKNGNGVVKEKKSFIMPCPNEDCRGFLSSAYKCGLCDCYTCPKCIKPIGYKNNQQQEPHVCNDDDIKTAELIKSTTKPCPSCGERIGKISGCDQMWCVGCHTAFSWRTGAIETGNVHNPHYYQWQKQHNGNVRNPNDIICGGLRNWWTFRNQWGRLNITENIPKDNTLYNKILTSLKDDMSNSPTELKILINSELLRYKSECENTLRNCMETFHKLYRSLSHLEQYQIPVFRRRVRDLIDHKDLRVKYLLKEITKEEMATQLYRHDLNRKRNIELLHIYELMLTVGIDIFNFISNIISNVRQWKSEKNDFTHIYDKVINVIDNFDTKIKEYNALRVYCNNELFQISYTYKTTVLYLDESFETKNKKIKSRQIYDKVITEYGPNQNLNAELDKKTKILYPNAEGGV